MIPSKRILKNELGLNHDTIFFECPGSKEKIWTFYDMLHLIKRLRDNRLDFKAILADATKHF